MMSPHLRALKYAVLPRSLCTLYGRTRHFDFQSDKLRADVSRLVTFPHIDIGLRAKLSGAMYCNRSCLWVCLFVCLFVCVCVSVTTITRNCVHGSSPNWVSR